MKPVLLDVDAAVSQPLYRARVTGDVLLLWETAEQSSVEDTLSHTGATHTHTQTHTHTHTQTHTEHCLEGTGDVTQVSY